MLDVGQGLLGGSMKLRWSFARLEVRGPFVRGGVLEYGCSFLEGHSWMTSDYTWFLSQELHLFSLLSHDIDLQCIRRYSEL